jgi:hypothetical protein
MRSVSRFLAVLFLILETLISAPAMAGQSPPLEPNTLPDELEAPAGTVVNVQVRDSLSSSRNSAGDTFVGVLAQPLVIDGWVVARAGQTVMGQVTVANKAGRTRGTSDLALELTEIVLVDGQQLPIRTQMVASHGRETRQEDTATIAGVTALGTIIGAATGGGKGALIGAGIGAGAATAGVLSTRGMPAEVHAESTLAFRLDSPLVISTERSQHAFVSVVPEDYDSIPALKAPPRQPDAEAYESRDYDRYPRFPAPPVRR